MYVKGRPSTCSVPHNDVKVSRSRDFSRTYETHWDQTGSTAGNASSCSIIKHEFVELRVLVGREVGQITEVTLRRARLVGDPVREIYLSLTNHPGKLIPTRVGAMSTGQKATMSCDWELRPLISVLVSKLLVSLTCGDAIVHRPWSCRHSAAE